MKEDDVPTWRTMNRRLTSVSVDDIRLLFDWSLSGDRIYQLTENDSFYITAKVTIETNEPSYPCRPSLYRGISKGKINRPKKEFIEPVISRLQPNERRVWTKIESNITASLSFELSEIRQPLSPEEAEIAQQIWQRIYRRAGSPNGKGKGNWEKAQNIVPMEFPCWDESTWTYQAGEFTTWLKTKEIKDVLAQQQIIKNHITLITMTNRDHDKKWKKLRAEVLQRYGNVCMRCGRKDGGMHVDHIKPWAMYPSLRYDIENLQVLCSACHAWKGMQEEDFRLSENQIAHHIFY